MDHTLSCRLFQKRIQPNLGDARQEGHVDLSNLLRRRSEVEPRRHRRPHQPGSRRMPVRLRRGTRNGSVYRAHENADSHSHVDQAKEASDYAAQTGLDSAKNTMVLRAGTAWSDDLRR